MPQCHDPHAHAPTATASYSSISSLAYSALALVKSAFALLFSWMKLGCLGRDWKAFSIKDQAGLSSQKIPLLMDPTFQVPLLIESILYPWVVIGPVSIKIILSVSIAPLLVVFA